MVTLLAMFISKSFRRGCISIERGDLGARAQSSSIPALLRIGCVMLASCPNSLSLVCKKGEIITSAS